MRFHMERYAHGEYSVLAYTPRNFWMKTSYVLFTPSGNVLIDPGFDSRGIAALSEEQKFKISAILLTNGNCEQMASAQELSCFFDKPVLLHPADHSLLLKAPAAAMLAAKREIELPTNLRLLDSMVADELNRCFGIELLHTPGQTAGSISIFCGDFAFSGDLFNKKPLSAKKAEQIRISRELFASAAENLQTKIIYPSTGKPIHIREKDV